MSEIYIVTHGKYSDYSVLAVFDNEKLAENFICAFAPDNNDSFSIEEYPLNPNEFELLNDFKYFFVRMSEKGEVVDLYQADFYQSNYHDVTINFDVKNNLYIQVFAKNEEHATKIVNEIRLQIIASSKWAN